MEDIEYLEEYEDLVLPALNSAAAAAAPSSSSAQTNKNIHSHKINDGEDGSSSSLDQDIFNCLFDDNSDDDEDYHDFKKSESILKKIGNAEHFQTFDDNIEEIDEKQFQKVEISRQDQTNKFNSVAKTVNKNISSVPKTKTFMTKTSGTTIPLITAKSQPTLATKAKSIATVRPTVQNQKQQQNIQKKTNLLQRQEPSSTSSFIHQQNPSTSSALSSSRAVELSALAGKTLLPDTSSPSNLINTKSEVPSSLLNPKTTNTVKKIIRRPATIVKPEKIITKDPINDPLELDDLSDAGSDNYSVSDISGETYNSATNSEEDDTNYEYYTGEDDDYYDDEYAEDGISSSSHIIEISNDSCGAPSNLDHRSDKKTFKEPPLKTTSLFPAKSGKTEKVNVNVLSSSSKRLLRSPAFDTESLNPRKKPKLEASRKPNRLRNLNDDCLEEVELPVVAAKPSFTSREKQKQLLPLVVETKKLNESTIILKTIQNKKSKESKEYSISEQKTGKVQDVKTQQITLKLPQKELAFNELSKQRSNKEALNSDLKTYINTKKGGLRLDETKPKLDKVGNVLKLPGTPTQPKAVKAKINPNPNKSPGSTVMSFSDWLKSQNKNNADSEDESYTATTNETTTKVPKEEPEGKEPMLGEKLENNIWHKTSSVKKDIFPQLDSSLPRQAENPLQNEIKPQRNKGGSRKANVKRLQKKPEKISPPKSITPTLTSPRMKRSEIDMLIDSMSKEMKDGGITDLLKSGAHVKRPRLALRRGMVRMSPLLKLTADTQIPKVKEKHTLDSGSAYLSHQDSSGLEPIKAIPKVIDFSENFDTTPAPKELCKSPIKRKLPQTSTKTKRSSSPIKKNILNSSNLSGEIDMKPDNSKILPLKTRKSLNIRDLPQRIETTTNVFSSMAVAKSRKSLQIMPKESLAKKQQRPLVEEKIEIPERNAFKTPMQVGPSTTLNITPIGENVKKLFADDKKRLKINQTESLLKQFKCRKLRIQLDRSIVENYLNSLNNLEKQMLGRSKTILKDVPRVPTYSSDSSALIQNHSETSLRIQSVVDASQILNTSLDQDSFARIDGPKMDNLQDMSSTSISISNIQQLPPIISTTTKASIQPLTTPLLNIGDGNETIELKNEFVDEVPTGIINESILPDTPTLLARAQSITEAAQHALSTSVTPTDIRLLATDSLKNNFVPSFGVTPTALDNKGTCMYTFLHPAKYNRNHSNVLLDYCCPNLDGPMPAIDPTRIHAQVQVPVIELPASIVLTTKVVTRTDLENDISIPAIIRKKAEKIRKNMATHHKLAVATTLASSQTPPIAPTISQPHIAPTPRPSLPPTINALTKQLPSTTTITPKIRPPLPQQTQMIITPQSSNIIQSVPSTYPKRSIITVAPKEHLSQLSNVQQPTLRSNLRRFDGLLKQLVQPYDTLNFVERHRIIEEVLSLGTFSPKDLEQTIALMEEYIKQTLTIKSESLESSTPKATPANLSPTNYVSSQPSIANPLSTPQMPQLQPSPKILASTAQLKQIQDKSIRNVQTGGKNASLSSTPTGGSAIKQRQVPIYDTDRNIIGYQMQMMAPMTTMPAYTKSTMSSHTGAIMSTSLDSSSNKITNYKRPVKRPAQDSPRVFYTTPPSKTSTPKPVTKPQIYPTQHTKNTNTHKTQGSIVRSGSSTTTTSETITTTTMATVKRVTRSTATGSKIIIVSKSNQSSEETILPDTNNSQPDTVQAEIKNEKDIEDFTV